MKIKLSNLDVLRALLAVYVIAGHCRWLLWAGHAQWIQEKHSYWANILAYCSAGFRYGHEAVIVFFVLSGFFIHIRAAQRFSAGEEPAIDIKKYFIRRGHRLVPPYLLALLITIIADMIGKSLWPELYSGQTGDVLLDVNFGEKKGYSISAVVSAMLLLPSASGKDFGTNGPLWSLAFETLYYLAYPLWLRFRSHYGRNAFVAVGIVSPLAYCFSGGRFLAVVLGHYYLWIAGAALAEVVVDSRSVKVFIKYLLVFIVCVAGLAACTGMQNVILILYLLLGIGCVMLIGSSSFLQRGRWGYCLLEALGVRSYSLYIYHFPLLVLISSWSFHVLGRRPMSGWLAMLGGGGVILISLFCFEICEKRFLHNRLRIES